MVYIQKPGLAQSGYLEHSRSKRDAIKDGTGASKIAPSNEEPEESSSLSSNDEDQNARQAYDVQFTPTPTTEPMVVTTTSYVTTELGGKSYVVPYVQYITATPMTTSTISALSESSVTSSLPKSSASISSSSSTHVTSTTSSSSAAASSHISKKLKAEGVGADVGIAVGSVVLFVVLVIGLCWLLRQCKKKRTKKEKSQDTGKRPNVGERLKGWASVSTTRPPPPPPPPPPSSSSYPPLPNRAAPPSTPQNNQHPVSRQSMKPARPPRPETRDLNDPYTHPRPIPTDRMQYNEMLRERRERIRAMEEEARMDSVTLVDNTNNVQLDKDMNTQEESFKYTRAGNNTLSVPEVNPCDNGSVWSQSVYSEPVQQSNMQDSDEYIDRYYTSNSSSRPQRSEDVDEEEDVDVDDENVWSTKWI